MSGFHKPDCNMCLNVSITENEQIDKKVPHVCTYYVKKVMHGTQNKNHYSYLHPCDECINDGYAHYLRRWQ